MFDPDKPVIAAVNGLAVGGGFELALACDLIIAAKHAGLFLPEVTIGMIPDSGGVFRLPCRLPRSVAVEILLTGRRMSATEAARRGLVNEVVPGEKLMATARELVGWIAGAAPLAVAALKEVIRATEHLTAGCRDADPCNTAGMCEQSSEAFGRELVCTSHVRGSAALKSAVIDARSYRQTQVEFLARVHG